MLDATSPGTVTLHGVETAIYATYILSLTCFIIVLFGGITILFRVITAGPQSGSHPLCEFLMEQDDLPDGVSDTKFSFSRFAGALGAIGFSAVFVSFGFWALCGLFLYEDMLARFEIIWPYLFASAVFFFPYAANQIGQRLRPTP